MQDSNPAGRPMNEGELIDRLAEAIAKRVQPAVPFSVQVWSTETIAAYLQRPPQVVRERIVCLPGFPAPIRLPVAAGSKATAHPRWKAKEVIARTESHQGETVGRRKRV